MRQRTSPLLTRHPTPRPSRVDFRAGLPRGGIDAVARVALDTRVHVSLIPELEVSQLRLLAVRISGLNPGNLVVSCFGVSSPVTRDGTFMVRGGGSSPGGAWREMLVGRLEGRRLLLSIYQLDLLGDRGPDVPPLACKILFRGTCWSHL
jgi:hypothetical protein